MSVGRTSPWMDSVVRSRTLEPMDAAVKRTGTYLQRLIDPFIHALIRGTVSCFICLFLTTTAHAGLEVFDFTGNVDKAKYIELISELRCLVCQNQSLVDSDAELAHDLRKEVYDLMDQGKSDAEIAQFLVDRYGDFVLYSPPVKPSTYLIWFGPFALLAVGLLMVGRILMQRRKQADTGFSDAEKAQLKQILGEETTDNTQDS